MSKLAKKRSRLPKANPNPEVEGKEDPKLPIILSSDNDDPGFKIVQVAYGSSSSSATEVKEKINKTNGRTGAQFNGLKNVEKKEEDGAPKESDATIETATSEKSNNIVLEKLLLKNVEKKEEDGAPKESDATIETAASEKSNNIVLEKLLLKNVEKKEEDAAPKESDVTIETATSEKSNNIVLEKLPGKDLFISKKGGHCAKDCPENSTWGSQRDKICLNCGELGHEMFSCKSEYSSNDLKEIQCYVCKCFGHLCCANYVGKGSRKVSCYRCGQLGHSGLECARVHAETGSNWTPSGCFMCRQEAHMACKCTGLSKKQKRKMELPGSRKKKSSRRKRTKTQPSSSQPKPIGGGGWKTQDPRVYNHNHGWGSPNTPAMYITNNRFYGANGYQAYDRFHGGNGYQPSNDRLHGGGGGGGYNLGYSNPGFYSNQGNFQYGSAVGSNGYQHIFSASRFGNSSNYGNGGHGWGY